GLASGRTFLAAPAPGQNARGLQARLLDTPGVLDALPEGGRVRFVGSGDGTPAGITVTPTEPRFEDGFMVLLRRNLRDEQAWRGFQTALRPTAQPPPGGGAAVEVRDLVRRFGSFTAVDHVTFDVRRGEVFGLLGPNGAGKTTTFRMLCGLLPATSGTLEVAGANLNRARASARQRIGYVAQKFALYGQLTVTENLAFFGSAY